MAAKGVRKTQAQMAAMQQRIAMNRIAKIPSRNGPRQFTTPGYPPEAIVAKVLVCGTRTFQDYDLFKRKMDRLTFWFDAIEIVIGSHGTRVEQNFEHVMVGADAMAKRWAEWYWWRYTTFWAGWDEHKKAAGPIRNTEMAKYVGDTGYCVAFWDGVSPGTRDMIDKFKRYCDPDNLKVIYYV